VIVEIPAYKHIEDNQEVDLSAHNIRTLIGGNGAGKSTLLESIFSNYINIENELREDEEISTEDSVRSIVFSSGQNELFSEIFNDYDRNAKRYKREDSQTIRSFYFDYWWSRLLVFFATSLKRDGYVRKYLRDNSYIDEVSEQDVSSYISLNLRVRKPLIDKIKEEFLREEKGEFIDNPLYRSLYISYLQKFVNHTLDKDFDFRDITTLNRVISTSIHFDAKDVMNILGNNPNEIFTFIARASTSWLSNFNLKDIGLYFKNDLEFDRLSDGEYQLLSIYALIDLFDDSQTLFLLDEVDSHLHYSNLNNLWTTLNNVDGKVIATTHISESILNNNFQSISYIESGKIKNELTAKKILQKLSHVVNHDKFIYQLCSKIENVVLIDDESDWEIFKQLARVKIGNHALDVLNKLVPIKETSSYNSDFQLFGNEKIKFVKEVKTFSESHEVSLKNIFLICDLDEYQISNVGNNHQCIITDKLRPHLNEIQNFNNAQTKPFLLSWKRREILHYCLSYTMIKEYGQLDCLESIASYINNDSYIGNNFDDDNNIKYTAKENVKFIKLLMSNDHGDPTADNWTNYSKVQEVVSQIPPSEISQDIVKMYEFIKEKVENN